MHGPLRQDDLIGYVSLGKIYCSSMLLTRLLARKILFSIYIPAVHSPRIPFRRNFPLCELYGHHAMEGAEGLAPTS